MKSNKTARWPQIRKAPTRAGTVAYMVDGRFAENGVLKGERHFFKTKAEADTKAEQLRTARKNQGTAAIAFPERLRVMATDCAARLIAVGATLEDATAYFLKHARPTGGIVKVSALIEAFIRLKEQAGRRKEYTRILKSVLKQFENTFGGREIHTVGHAEILEWMQGQPWKLRTRENYRMALSSLFAYGIKHGHCTNNPLEKIEKVTLDDKPPGIVGVEEAGRLLAAAQSHEGGTLLAYVAIGLFAGLRAAELTALDWREVSLAERTIEVTAAKSKTRARRIVHISDNLAAWLALCAQKSGPVVPMTNRGDRWRAVRSAAGLSGDSWPNNGLRHSFASYHVAKHKDAPRTSLEMGHDNPNQLFASYRELVKPAAAESYWKLMPVETSKIIAMREVAA